MTHTTRFSRFGAALLAATSLIPLLASCGGGGSSGPKTSNAATPVPTAVATSTSTSCNNATYSPNYASSVTLLHLPQFPISVFFKQDAQFSASRKALALAGFNRWVVATGNRADYTVVNSSSGANIVVSFYKFTGGAGDTLGTTTVSYSSDNVISKGTTMELGITGDAAEDTETAAHEYGHALGITGHSPTETDLMYYTGNLSGAVTLRDLNTVLTAYCNNFNRSSGRTSAAVGPLKTLVMH